MNKVGKFGEDVACLFLEKHSYKIVERNYSKKWGELDIVAKKAKKLCFVEVKTVSCEIDREVAQSVTHGTLAGKVKESAYRPEENMSTSKTKKFTRVIQTYLQEKGIEKTDWSAALVAIRVDTNKKLAKVRFIENLVLH